MRAGGSGGALGGRWERVPLPPPGVGSSPVRASPPRGALAAAPPGAGVPVRIVGAYRGYPGPSAALTPAARPRRLSARSGAGSPRGALFAVATGSRAGRRRRERFASFRSLRRGVVGHGAGGWGSPARVCGEGPRARDAAPPVPLLQGSLG